VPKTAGTIIGHDQMMGQRAQKNSSHVTNITVNISGSRNDPAQSRKSAGQIAVAVKRATEKANRDL
jgi:hypothetical protein